MKKWKYLLKVVMAVGVIAMTAVQICTAAEGTAELFCTARAEMKSVIRQVLPKS